MDKMKKQKRFDGLSEEEIQEKKNTLPDYLEPDLDLVFLGINPSLMAAHKERYYAGSGNHFYKLLYAAGLVPTPVSFEEDANLLQYKIGLTNIVARATRSSANLTTAEIQRGCDIVVEKVKKFKPRIAVFNGKCIYEVFARHLGKSDFHFGLQLEKIGSTAIWVVPSSSARCSNFPRMEDKLHFYQALKKYLMFLQGQIKDVNLHEFIFQNKSKAKTSKVSVVQPRGRTPACFKKAKIFLEHTFDDTDCNGGTTNVDNREFVITEIVGGNLNLTNQNSNCNQDVDDHDNEKIPSPTFSITRGAQEKYASEKENNSKVAQQVEKNDKSDDLIVESKAVGSFDFVNLVKRRLKDKKSNSDIDEANASLAVKKLKYGNLKMTNK